jgi:anthranilate synthase
MVTILRDDGAEDLRDQGRHFRHAAARAIPYGDAVSSYIDKLDERRGAVFSSNYEYPGRYTRWDTAVVDPPLGISSFGRASGSKPITSAAR